MALSSLPPQVFELWPRELSDVNTSEVHHGKSAALSIVLQQGAARQTRGAAHPHPQASPLAAASRAGTTRPAPQDPPAPKTPRSEDADRAPSPPLSALLKPSARLSLPLTTRPPPHRHRVAPLRRRPTATQRPQRSPNGRRARSGSPGCPRSSPWRRLTAARREPEGQDRRVRTRVPAALLPLPPASTALRCAPCHPPAAARPPQRSAAAARPPALI